MGPTVKQGILNVRVGEAGDFLTCGATLGVNMEQQQIDSMSW